MTDDLQVIIYYQAEQEKGSTGQILGGIQKDTETLQILFGI
jgi:hypothetical protein